ncbi:MAG TPA: hypothetical protein VF591_26135 [Pyrinomonadaceae bacterium]|jgi:hypothetical protein
MLICLTKSEIEKHADDIRSEFRRLPSLLRRSRSGFKFRTREWEFFQHCFDVLMGDSSGDFDCEPNQAKSYKFRVSAKLKHFYSARADRANARDEQRRAYPGRAPRRGDLNPLRFVFKLDDRKQAKTFLGANARYHSVNGYVLLVIPTDPALSCQNRTRGDFARTIDDAIHAEFDAYLRLPRSERELRESLKDHFDPGGTAYARLLGEVGRHLNHREVISNRGNPSTKPHLLEIEVEEATQQTARVQTKECWNLHWFSNAENIYARFWVGKNRQRYTLVRRGGRWLVSENEYDEPRG